MKREKMLDILGEMIECRGLPYVLDALSFLCAEKADRIRASHGDTELARAWDLTGIDLVEVVCPPGSEPVNG